LEDARSWSHGLVLDVIDPTIARMERSESSPLRGFVAQPFRCFSVRPAFTVIEMVVVVLLIAIIGGMIAPRLMRSERRLAERECEEVRRVLSIAASRSALSGQGILLSYDSREKTLNVFVLARVETNNGTRNEWQSDRMILPVKLDALAFRRGSADQQGLNASGWSVVFPTGEPRPMMWLAFSPASEPESAGWQIELMPDETGATKRRMNENSRASAAGLFRIDLDATNQGERAW